jgi:2,4-dienoyl-CoA reductase-like NADH-dependent reductase (Old Yellow Enzyme family)/thioredoxin reductase
VSNFPALFQSGSIGTLRLKNRLIMPAMGTQLADAEGRVTERLLNYYRARARGGVGLIIPQCAAISPDAAFPSTAAIYDDSWVADWRRLVDAVHEAGARICIQLMHAGMLFPRFGSIPEGMSIKVPSMLPWLESDKLYHVLSQEDIDCYVENFAEGARRVKEAGADAVELHACHGCLVSTFLSPATNRRTDQYGGSIENRVRFARRIVERIRENVGAEFPLLVRINADDDVDGGVTIDEAVEQAVILESAGVSAISVAGGLEFWSTLSIPCYPFPEGPMVPLAEKVKEAVRVPVIAVGKIGVELAERIVADGKVDFVAMGRPLLADPELPNKVREGRTEEIRRCIYCNNCLKLGPDAGPLSCSVNPFLSREAKYPMPRTKSPKSVMVVGGGLAGMETAIYLTERGHQVSLYEKRADLGGQWNVASATPGKEGYATLTDYLKRSLQKHRIAVTLGTEVTRDKVLETKPDVVVVATGAVPLGLNVPGANGKHVVQGHDVIEGKVEVKGKVVVVGGRFIGMEVAIWLKEQGRDVSLVTRAGLGQDGVKLEEFTFKTLADRLIELHVPLYLNSTVAEITNSFVIFRMGDEIFSLPADTVILSVGMRSVNNLAQELQGVVPEVYMVGDCVRPRDASEVSYQSAKLAASI